MMLGPSGKPGSSAISGCGTHICKVPFAMEGQRVTSSEDGDEHHLGLYSAQQTQVSLHLKSPFCLRSGSQVISACKGPAPVGNSQAPGTPRPAAHALAGTLVLGGGVRLSA